MLSGGKKVNNKRFYLAALLLVMLIVGAAGALPVYGNTSSPSISEGRPLPSFKMNMTLSPEMMQYLGLEAGPEFTLSQIRSKIVVIEVLSALCEDCHKNAPQVNKLFNIISNDPELNPNVKMMGIAVGNDAKMVAAYKDTYKVKFPIVTDPKEDINKLLGNVATPTIIMVDSKGMVLFIHGGEIDDMDMILGAIRTFISKK